MYTKLTNLESNFKTGKLKTVVIAGTTYYFILKQDML